MVIEPSVQTSAPLRAVFMGTPSFAATILSHLLTYEGVSITAVYTQPDRPAGRGKTLKEPEVKVLAKEHSIPVFQPESFKRQQVVDELADHRPDVLLVAAYGLILPKSVLELPRYMPINVHASLLPKYRGAAPIQRAIMDCLSVTGVTIMRMEEGLDTGPILLQKAMGIDIHDTAKTLQHDLAKAGGDLLIEALKRLQQGALLSLQQENTLSSHAAKLTKADGILDFSKTSKELHATIRGVTPWPGASFTLLRKGKEPLCINCEQGLYPFNESVPFDEAVSPGTIGGVYNNALVVRCGDGWYAFTSLRPAGKKVMDAKSFFNGYIAGHETASITII